MDRFGKLLSAGFAVAALMLFGGSAARGDGFTDTTMNLSNYTQTVAFTSDGVATLSASNCSSCGDPSGPGLQIVMSFPNSTTVSEEVAQGYINNTFSYDPLTQGAVVSINTSVDKDLTSSSSLAGGGTNTYRPMIEQDGSFYVDAITGPSIPPGGTTTGYNLISGTGLVAADFVEYDPATGVFGTANPNFDGDTMYFGLLQIGSAVAPSDINGLTADYDNLSFSIVSSPEPSSLPLLGMGLAALAILATLARRTRLPNLAHQS